MRVAIYIEKFSENFPDEKSFLAQLIDHIALLFPGSEFILIAGKDRGKKIISEKNIMKVSVSPVTGNTILWRAWLNIKLPVLLKKYNADIFIGAGFCSLKTRIPQCLLITDHSIFTQQGLVKRKHIAYYQRMLPQFFKKAKSVICFSNFVKNEIVNKYDEGINDILIIPPAAEEIFIPLHEEKKDKIKQHLTGGSEYFIYTGELNEEKNLIDLIKAFSVFKKMQQSSMKLVLAGKNTSHSKNLIRSLETYKYRDAVILRNIISHQELADLLGAAYAVVLLSDDGPGIHLLQAMRSGSCVISVKTPVVYEIAGDSALYFNGGDHSAIAAQMMHIYKDEDLRKDLIEKGKKLGMNYNIDRSAKLLWQAIEDALK